MGSYSRLSLILYCYCVTLSQPLPLSSSTEGNSDPQISLIAWISSDTSGGPSSYIKTDVSLDPDQEAPVTLIPPSKYILTSGVLAIGFSCKASYPVEWDFSNKQWMLLQPKTFGLYVTTSRRRVQDINDPSTYSYESQVVIYGDSRMLVGNYSCQGIDKKTNSRKQAVSVFWENGPFDNIFVLSGQNLTIYNNAKDQVIFPCHVHIPNAPVLLQKQKNVLDTKSKNENDTWINWSDAKLKYYPEIGFIYYGSSRPPLDFPESINYRCVLNVTKEQDSAVDQDIVYLSYVADPESSHDQELNLNIKSNATFAFNLSSQEYVCCSSSATPPVILTHSCGDEMSCKQLLPAMKTQFREASSTSDLNSGFNRMNYQKVTEYQTHHNGSCTYFSGYGTSSEMDISQCIGDGIRAAKMYFPRNGKSLPFGVWDLPKDTLPSWVQLEPMSSNPYKVKPLEKDNGTLVLYTGSTLTFRCLTTFYYFSYGIRFSLTKTTPNGKSNEVLLPETFDPEEEAMKRLKVRINFLTHHPPLRAKVNFTVTKDLKSFSCSVPVTKNQDWVHKTVKFSIKDPIPPTIHAAENVEVVSWSVNDTNKTLVCQVSGDPQPFVLWTKDSKPLSKNKNFMISRENAGKHVLHIPRVSSDMHGEIQCIAKNFIQDQVSKRFLVFVESAPGSSHTVAIVLCTLSIVVILIGVGFMGRKLYLQRRQLSGLRT